MISAFIEPCERNFNKTQCRTASPGYSSPRLLVIPKTENVAQRSPQFDGKETVETSMSAQKAIPKTNF